MERQGDEVHVNEEEASGGTQQATAAERTAPIQIKAVAARNDFGSYRSGLPAASKCTGIGSGMESHRSSTYANVAR